MADTELAANPAATDAESARLRDELRRQYQVWQDEKWVRLVGTILAYAMGLLYLSPWVVVPLALCNLALELLCFGLFRDIDRLAQSRPRRAVLLIAVFAIEACFALPPALMWHVEDPYAKSLAVGAMASTMMHLATVRSVHLPQGLWGGAAVALMLLGSNAAYWAPRGEWLALALTTVCGVVTLGYCLAVMLANHNLHRASAAGNLAALQANAAKDRLLATISHELRTPLNGILGMGHAELRAATTPEARARLSVLVDSAEGLNVLLDDILDMSAAREGKLAILRSRSIPSDEIAAAVLLFRHGSEGAHAPMTLDVSPDLSAPALLDRQRLRQCLSNLLSNALRHGEGAPIRVTARRVAAPGGSAMLDLTVADDGPGVPEALRPLLFEPFARLQHADAAQPLSRRGQGLGLSITRALARQMGGDLVLLPDEPAGRGAVFRLTLALPAAPAQPFAPAPAAARLDGLRVLVVDDIATNRLVATGFLHLAGAEAVEATSGAAALDRLAEGGIDAMLLDVNMPGLDGLATLQRIRALPAATRDVAVIATTADAGDGPRKRYLAAGFDGYLPKPVTPEGIVAAIAGALRQGDAGTGAESAETDIARG